MVQKHQILYLYYNKKMWSKDMIHKNLALSTNQSEINFLINDLVRVMKNTSLRVDDDEKQRNIQHSMNELQFSGYEKDEWIKIYQKTKK